MLLLCYPSGKNTLKMVNNLKRSNIAAGTSSNAPCSGGGLEEDGSALN